MKRAIYAADVMKTNVRLSKNMKEDFSTLCGDINLTFTARSLILNFIREYREKDFEVVLLSMLKYKTYRKIAYDDDDKDNTSKDYMLTLKLERSEYNTIKNICDEIGVSLAELVRRLINRAIDESKKDNNQLELD